MEIKKSNYAPIHLLPLFQFVISLHAIRRKFDVISDEFIYFNFIRFIYIEFFDINLFRSQEI